MPRSASSLQNLGFPSGAGDFLLRRFTESVSAHSERNLQFAVTQNLHAVMPCTSDACGREQLRCNGFACRKCIESLHVHHGVSLRERARKTALRQAPVQRHLAAFKSRAAGITTAGLLPLVTSSGSLPQLRSHASADGHLAVTR